jgi:hypothetical protein
MLGWTLTTGVFTGDLQRDIRAGPNSYSALYATAQFADVEGRPRQGTSLYQRRRAWFSPEQQVGVRYDPEDPSRFLLEEEFRQPVPTAVGGVMMIGFGFVSVLIGVVGLVIEFLA